MHELLFAHMPCLMDAAHCKAAPPPDCLPACQRSKVCCRVQNLHRFAWVGATFPAPTSIALCCTHFAGDRWQHDQRADHPDLCIPSAASPEVGKMLSGRTQAAWSTLLLGASTLPDAAQYVCMSTVRPTLPHGGRPAGCSSWLSALRRAMSAGCLPGAPDLCTKMVLASGCPLTGCEAVKERSGRLQSRTTWRWDPQAGLLRPLAAFAAAATDAAPRAAAPALQERRPGAKQGLPVARADQMTGTRWLVAPATLQPWRPAVRQALPRRVNQALVGVGAWVTLPLCCRSWKRCA